MTNPTPISTASSLDDLVERLRSRSRLPEEISPSVMMEAADEIERLRQPVAGDVVERANLVHANIMHVVQRHVKSDAENTAKKIGADMWPIAESISKLIGGGK